MERFDRKVAVVTGASSGIGAAIAQKLVEAGMTVVGLARRNERIEQLAKVLNGRKGKLLSFKTDMRKEADIVEAFKWITEKVGNIHVLVNNAGITDIAALMNGETEKYKAVLDINVIGLTIASRLALKNMMANNIDGHIININSIAGHGDSKTPASTIYRASKHAVTSLTESLRLELIQAGTNIKVTSLSPGFVETEILDSHLLSDQLTQHIKTMPKLNAEDIADAAMYILSTPPHVQVTELTIRPVGETA